jgi:hypothetical protein
LAQTRSALTQAEKDLERAHRKRKKADTSASRWRTRYENLRDQSRVAAPAPAAAAPIVETPPGNTPPTSSASVKAGLIPSTQASPDASEDGILPTESPAPLSEP